MNRCARCGRFTKEPHRHVTEVPFNLVTSEPESRRLLGSATIPDSTFEKQLAKITQQATMPPEDVERLAQNVRDLSPVRRRWPWRKRR